MQSTFSLKSFLAVLVVVVVGGLIGNVYADTTIIVEDSWQAGDAVCRSVVTGRA